MTLMLNESLQIACDIWFPLFLCIWFPPPYITGTWASDELPFLISPSAVSPLARLHFLPSALVSGKHRLLISTEPLCQHATPKMDAFTSPKAPPWKLFAPDGTAVCPSCLFLHNLSIYRQFQSERYDCYYLYGMMMITLWIHNLCVQRCYVLTI